MTAISFPFDGWRFQCQRGARGRCGICPTAPRLRQEVDGEADALVDRTLVDAGKMQVSQVTHPWIWQCLPLDVATPPVMG